MYLVVSGWQARDSEDPGAGLAPGQFPHTDGAADPLTLPQWTVGTQVHSYSGNTVSRVCRAAAGRLAQGAYPRERSVVWYTLSF